MGGVNFTRNRAWWHTAIWDEYNQRHQYLMIIPTFALLIPYYWHGTFINRDLEQSYAAKMYQLDYENKRNRLTHNLIMEHFEIHTEQVMDLLDEIKKNGFENTFKEYLDQQVSSPHALEMEGFSEDLSYEKQAEMNQFEQIDKRDNVLLQSGGYALETRNQIFTAHPRRQYPSAPLQFLGVDIPLSSSREPISHYVYTPELEVGPESANAEEEEESE